ncbi:MULTISPECIES: DUF3757 domain-containing protein [Pseudomonas]|uniref:Uncharacterized protein DUF3757 n=1 Tax=Pseudomonas poae TaxID=200451 RepID=A0A7Z1K2S8_9PSED|nr:MULTISPECIES: DUF3757 domain-containing protein [Pseudomonas]KAA8555267.1 hypothetical protein FX984_01894 [Pseudomonas marginalis]NMZ89997.1 DUF3757 domain-containing protein [Pseudomonas marginalis]PFG70522.1 uncharacterized protein DUF3757 [Pseudomonas poae]PUB46110.1 uncharacterized protein DUF3757 [Pseudomonas sp. GV047]SCX03451.1 Protein of unknown function [Pseudomonas sp. NFACC25]
MHISSSNLVSIRAASMILLWPAVLFNLAACTSSSNTNTAGSMCPGIGNIHQTKELKGYSYTALSPGSGWKGENPYAQEHYLKGMKFESAAIRTAQQREGQPEYYFVACDYEGPEQLAFLRMSQRFPVRPRAVGPNWTADDFCRAGSVDGCQFTIFTEVP